MKKIIISIAAASVFLFTGCFTDSDTATVRINLGNLPVAKVEKKSLIDRFLMIFAKEAVAQDSELEYMGITKVHLGAFDKNNKLLKKQPFDVAQLEEISDDENEPFTTTVEFDVPARSGVRIVVLGEIYEPDLGGNIAGYYGCSEPQNLTAGATEEVEVQMEYLTYLLNLDNTQNIINLQIYGEPEDDYVIIKWNRIYGVSNYILNFSDEDDDFEEIGRVPNEELVYPSEYIDIDDGSYQIELEFKFAGINSVPVNFDLWFF